MDVSVALWHERAARYFRNQLKTLHKSKEGQIAEAQYRLTYHETFAEKVWRTLNVNLINMKGQWVK